MKTVTRATEIKDLPPNHVAVLFEGPWLLTQDPEDTTRILAICPYTNDDTHICERGLWNNDYNALGGLTPTSRRGVVREGDQYRVDVAGNRPSPNPAPMNTLFQTASDAYGDFPFVYFQNPDATWALTINNQEPLMRRISIAMPDEVRPAGRNTQISAVPSAVETGDPDPADYLYKDASVSECSIYTTFIFIYALPNQGTLNVQWNGSSLASVDASNGANPHLVFRVRSTETTDSDGCAVDTAAGNNHIVASFDALRTLITVPATLKTNNQMMHIDVGLYPSAGLPDFDPGDTNLKLAELGLGPEGYEQINIRDLASCAVGPIIGDGGDGGGPPMTAEIRTLIAAAKARR